MIIGIGAAGFIGSNLIQRLNQDNFNAIIAVDNFDHPEKNKNQIGLKIQEKQIVIYSSIGWTRIINWLNLFSYRCENRNHGIISEKTP